MAQRKTPRTRYTVEEVYGIITSSNSDEDGYVGNSELQKEKLLKGLSEEEPYSAVQKDSIWNFYEFKGLSSFIDPPVKEQTTTQVIQKTNSHSKT